MSYLLDYKGWKRLNEANVTVNKLNGNMQDSQLVKINVPAGEATHKLNPDAAADYNRMVDAAANDGIVWGITDSYRTYAVQNNIFDWERFNRSGQRKKKGTNIAAAYPGTSNHGYGSAVDLNLSGPGIYGANQKSDAAKQNYAKAYAWLQQNAGRFGFSELKGEPWHWDHKPSAEKYARGGEAVVTNKAIEISKLVKDANPLLASKLELFEKGNLIINSEAKAAEDVILFIKSYLPDEYKNELGEDEIASPIYSEKFTEVISKFQKDKDLPRIDGTFDISTYNELFSNIKSGGKNVAVLVGGLDTRPGDLTVEAQAELLKKGLGGKNVKEFRYNAPTDKIINFLEENPKVPVFLFSAGCVKAYDLSNSQYVDKNKLYIIEPYSVDTYTKDLINKAVANGVPAKNVFVGATPERGKGTVQGETSSGGSNHWAALSSVGQIKSNIV